MPCKTIQASGGCLCGAVQYYVYGALRSIVACHCVQCQRLFHHYVAETQVLEADLEIKGADKVSWFKTLVKAKRGFVRYGFKKVSPIIVEEKPAYYPCLNLPKAEPDTLNSF